MRTEFMGENPSLTALFGDEVENDIRLVAAETGLPVDTVRNAVVTFAPELLGEEPAKGTTFGNVFKSIMEGVSTAAPAIAAAARGTSGTPAAIAAPAQQFDVKSLLIPAAIGGLLLFVLMKR